MTEHLGRVLPFAKRERSWGAVFDQAHEVDFFRLAHEVIRGSFNGPCVLIPDFYGDCTSTLNAYAGRVREIDHHGQVLFPYASYGIVSTIESFYTVRQNAHIDIGTRSVPTRRVKIGIGDRNPINHDELGVIGGGG